jgi:predicted translin family RNA/ssDNA-binding protein
LKAIGVDRDLNTEVGQSLAKASESIGSLVDKAGTAENAMDKAEENGKKIKEAIGELKDKLKKAPKEI